MADGFRLHERKFGNGIVLVQRRTLGRSERAVHELIDTIFMNE